MKVQSIRGGADLARFILARYSGKVVEVGVGRVPEVALLLAPHLEVVTTDKEARTLGGLEVISDDIFTPRLDVYRGASLLYSIRPPLEMQLAMGRLALGLGADVIVRPLNDEVSQIPGFSRSIVNEGEARFYLFTPSSREAPSA
ncbi:MAG TPA: UPF0146 family protein [Methanothrix sp.]|nr:UPF0146 family protein [Methanothrix sp.]HPJ83386.1 UPF0146 family protein [Methanothrix sp.]